MRTIILMRHGQAQAYVNDDAARLLTEHGRVEVRSTIAQLQQNSITPTRILSSTYQRAIETALIAKEMFGHASSIESDPLFLPDANALTAVDYLLSLDERCILLCCHMPIVSLLLHAMTQGTHQWSFPTAGASVLVGRESTFSLSMQIAPSIKR